MYFPLRLNLLAVVGILIFQLSQAQSYDYGTARSKILKRQSPAPLVVTGVQTGAGPSGSAPLRYEVRDLQKDDTTWTLYILGLDVMQNIPQTDLHSWYQIAGISAAWRVCAFADI